MYACRPASSCSRISLVDLVAPRLWLHPRLHRLATGRQVRNLRDVELAVVGEGERPRDRRRRHQQHVGPQSLGAQRRALRHAEAMLLVDHHQPEPVESDLLLHERVRADHQVGRPALDVAPGGCASAGRACCRSAGRRGSGTATAAGRCWRSAAPARISVGAMNATCRPFSIATIAASSATIVLPAPTSPCSSRCIGCGWRMSSTISFTACRWPGRQLERQDLRRPTRGCDRRPSARCGLSSTLAACRRQACPSW